MSRAATSLHVGILIDEWRPTRGGAEVALAAFVRYLESRGHVARVLAHEADDQAPGIFQEVPRDRTLATLLGGRGARARRDGARLVAAARAAGCDVTVGIRHLPEVDLYWPHGGVHRVSVAAQREARRWRARTRGGGVFRRPHATAETIVQPIQVALRGRHRAYDELERGLLAGGQARRIACVSTLVRDELARLYPEAVPRLLLVPNGVDTARFHPGARAAARAALVSGAQLAPEAPVLTYVARNAALKGLNVLLRALCAVEDEPWSLVVAGIHSDVIQAHGVPIARWLAGPSPRMRPVFWQDPLLLAAGADILVAPTWRDTSGLAILEALACGTPVITTARAGAAEFVRDRECGIVLPAPGDAPALADAIRAELQRVRAGVDRARIRSAVSHLDAAACHARLEETLVSIVEERARRP